MAWHDKVAHHSGSSPLPVIPKLSYELYETYIERENFLNGMENKTLFNQNGFVLKAKENRPIFQRSLLILQDFCVYLLNLSLVQVKIDFQDRFRSSNIIAKEEVDSHCACILVSLKLYIEKCQVTQQHSPSFHLSGGFLEGGHYRAACINTKCPAWSEEVSSFCWLFYMPRTLFSLQKSVTLSSPCSTPHLFLDRGDPP